jgi:hypothetical protein
VVNPADNTPSDEITVIDSSSHKGPQKNERYSDIKCASRPSWDLFGETCHTRL